MFLDESGFRLWRGFITIDAPTDHGVFLAFVEQELVSNLRPGDLAAMDAISTADIRAWTKHAGYACAAA